jgi:Tol biopolymer transport system component
MKTIPLMLLASCLSSGQTARKQGSPLDALPKNIEILTHFGERADFSPSNTEVAFMAKSFGDAFVINLKTRAIRCLTCSLPGAAFLRVMDLSNGDYVLIGAEEFTDIHTSRGRDNELWYLSRKEGSKPVLLNQKMSEGAAISKQSMLISFSGTSGQNPKLPAGASNLILAEMDLSGEKPALKNKRVVLSSPSNACTLEAQDFFDQDSKMTYTCYEPRGLSSVWTIDLATKQTVNQTKAIGSYNEVEGNFPGGQYTCVESDQQGVKMGSTKLFRDIDIWKLKLDGTGKSFERLTRFNDYEGGKASNPVVSTNGKMMAFQFARGGDEAGVGYGILLMHFRK